MRRSDVTLAVEARGLSKEYAAGFALRDLELAVPEGEVFGLLGPNGAGKTTTLHLLLDFIHPTSGVALLFGRPASDPRTRARVGYLPESLSLHGYYRGDDLLDFYGALLEMAPAVRRERAATLLRLLDLESVARRRVATYSKGTLQRLGFAQALLNDPDLLVLDEPTSSLDPLARRRFSEILRELKARGKTILISSHLLSEVETICDRVAILKDGELARSGRLDDLLATPAVRIRVRRVPSALIDEVVGLGAEVGLAGDETTVRCPNAKTRDAVIAILEANGVHVDGTEAETRSLEGLFVEMMAG